MKDRKRDTARIVMSLTALLYVIIFWSMLVTSIFNPPTSLIISFVGGWMIGIAYVFIEFDTIDKIMDKWI